MEGFLRIDRSTLGGRQAPSPTKAELYGATDRRRYDARGARQERELVMRPCASITAMKPRWLLDREDPRTVLAVCILILVFGVAMAAPMLHSGIPRAFLVIWYMVSVAQVIWAALRYRQWRRRDG